MCVSGSGGGDVLLVLNAFVGVFSIEPSLWKVGGLPGELKTDVLLLQHRFQQSERSNTEPYGLNLS